jgi:hypothetical protein
VDAALFDGRGLRVLILVYHVLVGRLLHELPDLGFDPGGAEGGEILLGVAIEDELIVDGLVDGLRVLLCLGELVAISLLVQDLGLELAGRTSLEIFGVVQRHSFSCLVAFKVYLLLVEAEKKRMSNRRLAKSLCAPYRRRILPCNDPEMKTTTPGTGSGNMIRDRQT